MIIEVLSIGIVFVCRLLLVYICKVEHGSASARIIFNVLRCSAEMTPVVCFLNGLLQKDRQKSKLPEISKNNKFSF